MTGTYFVIAALTLALMSGPTELADQLSKARANVVQTTKEYKASLEKLLAFYEGDVRKATELIEKRKEIYAAGGISRQQLEESERALAAAQANVEKTHNQIARADELIAETEAAVQLAKSAPMRLGAYHATATLIRYNGPAKWSLSDAAKVESFFTKKFGRALPVSAFGQTDVHDRMGFDHRNAMDVALHPDSSEGQALMAYLRSAGIAFMAFRHPVPGSATGAHIHIGKPSQRITANLKLENETADKHG